ncbi:SusD/RagB family nutrient-binding outer membrane lipoprotein [Chitinophaga filiformis]|uniref:SusD/RagB family nutrient-binding outer membrane lipoprotein n=1 Tax=Chitinophaga filiformis TaxID=104663 RepID=A0ABY4I808_CHIFI|nr:SusD/RagB family nutrient-binding outer membrane lipoprotein [Chitinophaga filiformis]UPK71499.1 SusD/RagB family nutrient-binding outer membrane lipoprotein [Chitinophaga filiformis]
MTTIYSKFKKYGIYAMILGTFAACQKSKFAEINTNPEKLPIIQPEGQFLDAVVQIHSGDFEYFYDFYRTIMPFTESIVANGGNSANFISDNTGNANNRYGYYYTRIGNDLTNVVKLIEAMPADEQAKRKHQVAIAQILNIYYAWYVSDINGSIPYSEAFQARYTGNFTPKYDTQEQLYTLWDSELKAISAVLSDNSVPQVSYGANDLYYGGNSAKWLKCANTLRLKIASRLSKVAPDKFKSIATEVLAAGNLFESNSDDLKLLAGDKFTQGGNWNPAGFHASKSLLDFMLATGDPRLRVFYQKNDYSKENFDSAVAQGALPANAVFNPNQYVGSFSSPDAVSANPGYFRTRKIKNGQGKDQTLDTVSLIQYRLFQPEYVYKDAVGQGHATFPLLTFADLCFLRAEMAAKGIAGSDAQGWYYQGIEASIRNYDQMASDARLGDYTPLTDAEIAAYKTKPGVAYDPANAEGLIASQAFLNYFKTPNEAWAILKRLGMPNATTPLALEVMKANGVVQVIPRRASLNVANETNVNAANNKAALDEMAQNPDFGEGPSDIFGRVWWDKK